MHRHTKKHRCKVSIQWGNALLVTFCLLLFGEVHPCPGPRGETSHVCVADKRCMTAVIPEVLLAPGFDLSAWDPGVYESVLLRDQRSGGCLVPMDQWCGGEEFWVVGSFNIGATGSIGVEFSPLSSNRGNYHSAQHALCTDGASESPSGPSTLSPQQSVHQLSPDQTAVKMKIRKNC